MKPRPRTRKAVKWGGLAVTVLLSGIWVGSTWMWTNCTLPASLTVGFGRGRVFVNRFPDFRMGIPAWKVYSFASETNFLWTPDWSLWGSEWFLELPLWTLVAVAGLAAATAWRRDTLARRRARNGCPRCGYDRAGLAPSALCPECGQPSPAQEGPGPLSSVNP